MDTKLNPYISFNGNARQAMEFYKSVFGGKLTMNTFKDYHLSEDPSEDNKIMHAVLEVSDCFAVMGADTPNRNTFEPGKRISISLSGENESQLKDYFQKLSSGGRVGMPLEKAAWGDLFGMLTDKFGVDWMVNIAGPNSPSRTSVTHSEQHAS